MSEETNEPVINVDSTKSIQAAPAKKPASPGGRMHPPAPVARWKRWHFRSSIILVLLGASALLIYLLRSRVAEESEGIGAALCAVACGGFLVWHVIHLFAEQDKAQVHQLEETEATVSSPQPNPVGKETYQSTPPRDPK